jgi:multimeric flavodoxin WrbA
MKITLVHGQNRKGSSYNIGRLLVNKLSGTNEIVEFFLPKDLGVIFCLGCYQCIKNPLSCPYYKEKQKIMDAILDSDLLIFTSPTYCMLPSAAMKTFIDLTFNYWMVHRPDERMFNKKAVVISTAAGMGAGKVTKDIADTLFYWGVPKISRLGFAVQAMNWESVNPGKKNKIEKSVTKLAAELSKNKKVRVGFKTRFMFNMMRMMQKNGMGSSPEEKEYWQAKGWLDKDRPWKQ